MSRVDELRKAGSAYSVKFLEFTRIYSKDKISVTCIFEGEDEKYFSQRVTDGLAPLNWNGLNAGGKKVVLDLFGAISTHPEYEKSRYICFIDRDFEDWLDNPNPDKIYITPCYSIENFYVSEDCFKRIISSEFKVTEFNEYREEFGKCLGFYRSSKSEFAINTSHFNYWVKAHRIMERDDKAPSSLNVRNVKIGDLVTIDFNGINASYDFEDPTSVFKDSLKVELCSGAMEEAQASLPIDKWESRFRGKQVAEFIRILLMLLKTDRTSRTPSFFSEKGSVRLSLSKDNLISELSQYADTPSCLIDFLGRYKSNLAV